MSCANVAQVAATDSPNSGRPTTQDGGSGGPLAMARRMAAPRRSAFSARVAPTITTGASMITVIRVTIAVAARLRRPPSQPVTRRKSGHIAAHRIAAQTMAVRNGCSTRKQPTSRTARTTSVSALSMRSADFIGARRRATARRRGPAAQCLMKGATVPACFFCCLIAFFSFDVCCAFFLLSFGG